jgi:hypothetical protein
MRGGFTRSPQGLTSMSMNNLWRKQMNLKLKHRHEREVTERRQVGDAESMINEGSSSGASGHHGLFRGEGGEV